MVTFTSPYVNWMTSKTPYGRYPFPAGMSDRARIVYTNDWHENYQFAPRMVSAFHQLGREAQQRGMDVFKLCAGDWNIGKEADQLELNVNLNNRMGVISTLGNHDFDAGALALSRALTRANFPVLAHNLYVPGNSALYQRLMDGRLITSPIIYTSPQGKCYGIVGITTPSFRELMNPDTPMEGVDSLSFEESIRRLQTDIDRLNQSGINRIILESHCGYRQDLEIARRTRGLDVIVGGHTHTELPDIVPGVNFVKSASGEPVMIVQAGRGRVGALDLAWDFQDKVHPLSNSIHHPLNFPKDPYTEFMVNRYIGQGTPIGCMAETLVTTEIGDESAPANGVVDAIREATGTDIAFFRAVEFRNDIAKGIFTDKDLQTLLPFTDKLVILKMNGAEIMEVLNDSASFFRSQDDHHPGLIHPSGLRYSVNRLSGKAMQVMIYNRVKKGWVPLEPSKNYSVAVGEFITKNRKEYPTFKRVPVIGRSSLTARDAFNRYILAQKGKPIVFRKDGRVKVV